MRITPTLARLAILTVAVAATAGTLPAASPHLGAISTGEDWPQFRGPARDGHSSETGLFDGWKEADLAERWRVPLGAGYSSVAIAGDTAVTAFGENGGEYLAAFDTTSGTERWRVRIGDLLRDGQGDGPRATPTIVEGRVFMLGGHGDLVAADLETGQPLWRRDLGDDFGGRKPTWGFSGSPLAFDDALLVEAGGRNAGVVALGQADGQERWRALDDRPGYATPILIRRGDRREAVFFTAGRVVGIDVAGGAELWSYPWETSYDVNAATPIFVGPDRVFVASGYGVGAALLRLPADTGRAEAIWSTRGLKNQFSSSVIVDGAIYGFDGSVLVCHDLETGERLWRERGYGHGSLIYADGHLVVLGDRGNLGLLRVNPARYDEVARQQVFSGRTWTPPSLSRRTLYLRDERELLALELDPQS